MSRNSADTGLRVMNSIAHHRLDIPRAVFVGGADSSPYLEALGAHLFLSADPVDVQTALAHGHAAVTIIPSRGGSGISPLLHIACDGDTEFLVATLRANDLEQQRVTFNISEAKRPARISCTVGQPLGMHEQLIDR